MSEATDGGAHGLVAQLRDGPKVYFGSNGDLGAKWAAAAAVLADSGSAGADYIDVTVAVAPGRRGGVGHRRRPASSASSQGIGGGSGSTVPDADPQRRRGPLAQALNLKVEPYLVNFGNSPVIVESWAICNVRCESVRTVDFAHR